MNLVIGGDHATLSLKAELCKHLQDLGYTITDVGTHTQESVDYPDYARLVCESIQSGKYERGILLCGTGIGISIAANKFRGIRCALCSEPYSAKMTREHNDANVLAMGARVIGPELAKMIVDTFLETEYSHGANHQRRLDKISALEAEQI